MKFKGLFLLAAARSEWWPGGGGGGTVLPRPQTGPGPGGGGGPRLGELNVTLLGGLLAVHPELGALEPSQG